MELEEKYRMYDLAYQLTGAADFEVLDFSDNEIWLTRKSGKVSKVVRLYHGGFDWKNHMKNDIAQVFQKIKSIKRLLRGKQIEIHNVYIATYAPVDDWEILKKPMQLQDKHQIKMYVYYLSDQERNDELQRLQSAIEIKLQDIPASISEEEMSKGIDYYLKQLAEDKNRKQQEMENLFTNGRPMFTYILLAVNLLVFALLSISGGSTSTETLIRFGAKYNPAIIENGQWWRIVSSMFLHIGVLHLAMNMLAVYYLGAIVERLFGTARFILIYFLAGIGGGLASFAFTENISAGASGALFGLFGSLLFFGVIHKKIFFQTIGMNLLVIIGINILFGLMAPQIDNGAHMGGLLAGFIASAVVHLPGKRAALMQILALILYVLFTAGLVSYGVNHNITSPAYQLMNTQLLNDDGKYEAVIDAVTTELTKDDDLDSDLESQLLFQRSYAYIQLGKINPAIDDLEHSAELNKQFTEAHYNLAILYAEKGNEKEAARHIRTAYQLTPDEQDIRRMYEQITGQTVE
ncbi:rhomboid family intramembrane serine protease [Lentibacillus cibarius]|uniref:Rhomboid family intramembrane serine protease n=1 Tax=Lentibacillus cibarius TaxID=2583219 RepID=A0A549YLG2_9BACI|nr:rhomboid family intramembrane serine protease [Lentibacillus cibarius]TRM12710.1 rhomboid family intramembrane serine protease [Lentibacillus cibarius]